MNVRTVALSFFIACHLLVAFLSGTAQAQDSRLEVGKRHGDYYWVVETAPDGSRRGGWVSAQIPIDQIDRSALQPLPPLDSTHDSAPGIAAAGGWTPSQALTRQAGVTPPRTPRTATGRAAPLWRGFLSMNGAFQATANNFDDADTFRQYGEHAHYSTDYQVKGGPTLDVAAGMRVWRRLNVGAGVTRFSRSTPVALDGTIPHPFFFARPRSIAGDVSDLKREELAVHVQARIVVPVSRRVQATVFGGPSFFQLKQGLVTGINYSEQYPYDAATFLRAETKTAKDSKIGLNAGGDFAFFFARRLGVGATAQFSATTVELESANGGAQETRVGGFQVGGGLRVRF